MKKLLIAMTALLILAGAASKFPGPWFQTTELRLMPTEDLPLPCYEGAVRYSSNEGWLCVCVPTMGGLYWLRADNYSQCQEGPRPGLR